MKKECTHKCLNCGSGFSPIGEDSSLVPCPACGKFTDAINKKLFGDDLPAQDPRSETQKMADDIMIQKTI